MVEVAVNAAPAVQRITHLSPHFLWRAAGIDTQAVDAIVLADLRDWAQRLMDLDEEIARLGPPVVDAIHAAVHDREDNHDAQCALIQLKRDAFNGRAPKGQAAGLDTTVAALAPHARDLVGGWLALVRERESLLSRGPAILKRDIQRGRGILKKLASWKTFRQAAQIGSLTFENSLDTYLADGGEKLSRRLRLTERTLLLYLTRMAFKTSPFSTFTNVVPGIFAEETDVAFGGTGDSEDDLVVRSRLNLTLITRLSAALTGSTAAFPDLPVVLKPACEIREHQVQYLRRIVAFAKGGGATVKEVPFFLPLTPMLRLTVQTLQGRTFTIGELTRELVTAGGFGSREVKDYLQLLLRVDLLTAPPEFRLRLDLDDPIEPYCQALERQSGEVFHDVARSVRAMSSAATSFAAGSLAERRAALETIVRELTDCCERLRQDVPELPQTMVYEDATRVPRQQAVRLDRKSLARPFESLATLQKALPALDSMIAPKLAMRAFFQRFYGAKRAADDFLSFAHIFHHDYYRPYWESQLGLRPGAKQKYGNTLLRIPELDRLDEARSRFSESLDEALRSPADGEARISQANMRKVIETIPAGLQSHWSHSFFVQTLNDDGRPRFVLNHVYNGLSQMYSRFLYLYGPGGGPVGESIRNELDRLQPADAIWAELHGSYDHNLNLHPSVTGYGLVFPGEPSCHAPERQIPLEDLVVVDDIGSNSLALFSRRLNRRVIPVYMGGMSPMFLPTIQQVLMLFSMVSFADPAWWSLRNTPPAEGDVTFLPRLSYDDVILERARWTVTPKGLPEHHAEQADAGYFLKLARWRRSHGIPRRAFLRTIREETAGTEGEKPVLDGMSRKPQYIDFDSFFTVVLFEKFVRDHKSNISLTEMLPTPERNWLAGSGKTHVSELLVQLTGEGS